MSTKYTNNQIIFIYLQYYIEANHNKDYSVVKTSKAVLKKVAFFLSLNSTTITLAIQAK